MLAFRLLLVTLVAISINASAQSSLNIGNVKETNKDKSGKNKKLNPQNLPAEHKANAIAFTKTNVEEQTSKNNDTTQPSGPRNGKYLILSSGSNPANPTKLGYFTLNGSEYKYYDLEGKLLGEGTYSYAAAEKQIKWQSGPFKAVGWDGDFEIVNDGKTHNIRLHSGTIGTNTLE
jgi:hypothetical protein